MFDQESPHYAIAIGFLPGTSAEQVDLAIDTLGSAIHPLLSNDEVFDFFPSGDELGEAIMQRGENIYTRGR